MIKAIIPCCGQGKRAGMKPNESKELLSDEYGNLLIEYTLFECKANDIEPLILVRKEKQDLINYCNDNKICYIIMEPGKEWSETVYNSKEHWNDKNILLLPDTNWSPPSALNKIKRLLIFGSEVVFGIHNVDDISKWGQVTIDGYCEKPKTPNRTIPGYAWGIIGFTKSAGKELFELMQNSNHFYYNRFDTQFVFLDEFEDLTRNEKN